MGSVLWALLPIYLVGFLSWVPVLHAWTRLRRRALLNWTLAIGGTTALAFVLLMLDPSSSDSDSSDSALVGLATTLLVAAMIAGSIQSFRLRREVFGDTGRGAQVVGASDWHSMAAVAQVEHARARRAEARALVEKDPGMARELRIGRPDLPNRAYDNGGLVDVNHASAQAMVDMLELRPAYAEEIVRAREEAGGFSGAAELGAYTSLPAPIVDGLGERAVFLRY
nr:helix-hairpin-helix domain-containing protein [Actinopolymorpha rutila]